MLPAHFHYHFRDKNVENSKSINQLCFESRLNLAGFFIIIIALVIAYCYQLGYFELPCPLCLLQRVGLILSGCGFLLNLVAGNKNSHYGLILLSSLATAAVAARQVLLHITAGDPGYGSAFIGLHFYTWALLLSLFLIGWVAIILLVRTEQTSQSTSRASLITKIVVTLFILLIAANLCSTILECGAGQCADDPIYYQLLHHS